MPQKDVISDVRRDVSIMEKGETTHVLEQTKCTVHIKYLSVSTTPGADYAVQHEQCFARSQLFCAKLRVAYLTAHEACTAYHAIWISQMHYTLTNVWFTEAQCVQLQDPVIYVLLPKHHLNSHLPWSIVYGKKYGGLAMKKYTENRASWPCTKSSNT